MTRSRRPGLSPSISGSGVAAPCRGVCWVESADEPGNPLIVPFSEFPRECVRGPEYERRPGRGGCGCPCNSGTVGAAELPLSLMSSRSRLGPGPCRRLSSACHFARRSDFSRFHTSLPTTHSPVSSRVPDSRRSNSLFGQLTRSDARSDTLGPCPARS